LLASAAVASPFAQSRFGAAGVASVIVAAGVCWLSGLIALTSSILIPASSAPDSAGAVGFLFGMFARAFLPMGVGLMLDHNPGPLATAGVFGWIVIFYLVTLIAETSLSLYLIHVRQTKSQIHQSS
jgi:hypothetical protein